MRQYLNQPTASLVEFVKRVEAGERIVEAGTRGVWEVDKMLPTPGFFHVRVGASETQEFGLPVVSVDRDDFKIIDVLLA